MLPEFFWKNAGTLREGTKAVDQGYEAVHFPGGVSNDHLGPEGCEELYLAFKDIDMILALRIGENEVDEVGAGHLGQLLAINDAIVYFCLYNNKLTLSGVKPICQALAINRTLVSLQLVNCAIGPDGAAAIANELENTNRSLIQIDISDNNIQDAGAKAFAKALRVNDIITSLHLGSNEIGNSGIGEIAEALTVNFTLCQCDLSKNPGFDANATKVTALLDRNIIGIRAAVSFCNTNMKSGPLRKAKVCFVGKNKSGKSALINSLKGCAFVDNYVPTKGAKVSQVLTRLKGDTWYGVPAVPTGPFSFQFLSRFANVKLDEKIDEREKRDDKTSIGFAALKKRKNRRGSVQQRRASVTGTRRASVTGAEGGDTRNSINSARQSRRSSVAMSVLNAVLGDAMQPGGGRRNSIKGLADKMAHPFKRKKNDLLADTDYTFFKEGERAQAGKTGLFSDEQLTEMFDISMLAKARRERDNLGFNLLELSGNRSFYTVHHSFLTEHAIYVLVFDMVCLSSSDIEIRMNEIRYLNYWLKVIKYHSPEAKVLVAGTRLDEVGKAKIPDIETDISKLVFPELHRQHAERKQGIKINKAVQAANAFAADLEAEAGNTGYVNKKINLIVNEQARRLFFPVELTNGKGVDAVRLAVDSAAQEQKYFGQMIPGRWVKFLDALRKDSPQDFCRADRVKALAFQNLENSEEEMYQALTLFHELGYIIHLKEINELEDTVITNTLDFHESLFKIIFSEDLSLFNFDEVANESGLSEDLTVALKTGIISDKLLDHLWTAKKDGDTAKVLKDKEFLLDFSQLTLVLSKYNFGGAKRYLIPSMIKEDPELVLDTKQKYGEGLGLKCRFSFKGFLTLGVYERLVCLCIQYANTQANSLEPILAMGWGQICFGTAYVFRIERLPDDIVLHIIESKKKPNKLVKSFEDMLFRLKTFLGKGFQWETFLHVSDDEKLSFEDAKAQKLKGWF